MQLPLDAAVLVAEGDFQMHDLFAVALEAEMSRFDHPGMHRTDRHLVHLFPLDPVELLHRRQRPASAPRPQASRPPRQLRWKRTGFSQG